MPAYDPEQKDTKDFYLNPRAAPRRLYLLALALGKFIVPHGLSERSYKALIDGKETRKRRGARSDSGFVFMGSGLAAGAEPDSKGRGRRGRGAARRGRGRRGRGRGLGDGARVAAPDTPLEEAADEHVPGAGEAPHDAEGDGGDSIANGEVVSEPHDAESDDVLSDENGGDGLATPVQREALPFRAFEDELAALLEEDLVPLAPELGEPVHLEPPPPAPPPPDPPPPHPPRRVFPGDDLPLRVLFGLGAPAEAVEADTEGEAGEPAAGAREPRGPRTVDQYPRLKQRPSEQVLGNRFHGLRCVRNPLLHGGKWDSMRAICGFHGARCEASRTLNANIDRPEQGRVFGVLWSFLMTAEDFLDKDSHCAAVARGAGSYIQAFPVRSAARRCANEAISALPDPEMRMFWRQAERPPWPGEGDEPEVAP